MLSINTNLSSLIAQNSMSKATDRLNLAIERMTSGAKINHAKDNAANYSISTNLTTKIGAYDVAADNVAMGMDLIATANGSLDQISDKLQRLRDLAEQASNGTYGTESLRAINAESVALVDEINRLYNTAEYNGKKLLQAIPAESPLQTYSEAEIAAMTPISESSDLSENTQFTISTAEDLAKLATLTNSGVSTSGKTFVLLNDIDLSAYSSGEGWVPIGTNTNRFEGTFDGNGHVISNLTINRPNEACQGLFGCASGNLELKNIHLKNASVSGKYNTGALLGYGLNNGGSTARIENNFVTCTVTGTSYIGGLIGCLEPYGNGYVSNNYVSGDITGNIFVAALVGESFCQNSYNSNYVEGSVTGNNYVAGLVNDLEGDTISNCVAVVSVNAVSNYSGLVYSHNHSRSTCDNCFSTAPDTHATQKTKEEIMNEANLTSMGFTEANGWYNLNGQLLHNWDEAVLMAKGTLPLTTLQVGINTDSNSQISMNTGVKIDKINVLRGLGLDTTTDFISQLDEMLSVVNSRQTELGAVENRLNSALDEISIQYENLVSSRSTIRDADIADESSEYIRQQILQQAASTLLATANQSPSIALQLI